MVPTVTHGRHVVTGQSGVSAACRPGAWAALLGRPVAWGLAPAGEVGVRQVIGEVLGEFDLTLGWPG